MGTGGGGGELCRVQAPWEMWEAQRHPFCWKMSPAFAYAIRTCTIHTERQHFSTFMQVAF